MIKAVPPLSALIVARRRLTLAHAVVVNAFIGFQKDASTPRAADAARNLRDAVDMFLCVLVDLKIARGGGKDQPPKPQPPRAT